MNSQNKTVCNEGVVKFIDGEFITVEISVHSACSSCHAKSICLPSENKNQLVKAKNINNETFQIGELVSIYMKESLGKKAVIIGYVIPFIVLFATLFISNYFLEKELLSALIALGFVGLYYFIIRLLNRKNKIDREFVFFVKKLTT
jgi:sigma-E factor negative regulatory protein RseC